MSEIKTSSQSGTSGTAGASNQRPKCFRDILDVVLNLNDEEWKAVSRDMPREVTRLEFASACTKIVTSVSSAVVRRLLKPLSKSFGIDAIVDANERLKTMESKSNTSDASAGSSPTNASEFICHLGQRIVTEIKGAMMEAIRRTASQATSPLISQLDDLSVSCTNEICDKILALYHAEELGRPRAEKASETSLKSHQEVHGIMKSLEQVVSISRSSSSCTVSSDAVTKTDVTAHECASSAAQAERPFSDQFMSKASQVISEVLLKTEQKLSASLSPQTSGSVSSEMEMNLMTELAESTATEILQKLFFILVQSLRQHLSGVGRSDGDQSEPEREQKFLSEAQKIHTDIHKQVFRFFRRRQQAVAEQSQTILEVRPEASAEVDISAENLQGPDAAERYLDQFLVKKLSSHISAGSASDRGSGATPPSKASLDLGQVVSDNVNMLLREEAPEMTEVADVEKGSEDGLSDKRSERKSSEQSNAFTPKHLFTVVANHMKAFVSSFKKSPDHDEELESTGSEVQEPPERQIGRSFSDSVLGRANRTLYSVQFPSELIHTFIKESTKGLLQNVLNTSSTDAAEDQKGVGTRAGRKNNPRKQQKQNGVSPSQEDDSDTSSHRESENSHSVFRRTLGRLFSRPSPETEPKLE